MLRLIRIGLALVAAALAAPLASAQTYPDRTIKLIVPFPAGGTNDIMARIFAQQLEKQIGETIVIDNRGGANGIIGTQAVATAEPDGYTLMHNSSSFTINPSIYKSLPYNIFKDFTPVANLAIGQGYLVVVNPELPVHNAKELIAYAKKNRVLYGSAGTGNPLQLAAALFNVTAGVHMESIPFRGTAPALNALLTGTINVMFVPPASVLPYIEAKQMRAVAFTGDVRPKELPDVPLMKDALPELKIRGAWHGWLAPANTPPDVVKKLSGELVKTLEAPRVVDLIRKSGYEPYPLGSAEFGALLKESAEQMAAAVKAAKIEPQ